MKPQLRFTALVERKGFTIAPNVILTTDKLTPHEKTLYLLLRHYSRDDGECWPGQDRLADQVPCARPSLAPMLKKLASHGLIEIRRQGQGLPNLYRVPAITDAIAAQFTADVILDDD